MKSSRTNSTLKTAVSLLAVIIALLSSTSSWADGLTGCDALGSAIGQLKSALSTAQTGTNGGLGNQMWGTLVARDGTVCAVAFSGPDAGAQWLLSRVISAQKANTANGLSVANFAISTANLYSAVNPGGSLYGLQFSNPVDPEVAYAGAAKFFGTQKDPMDGNRIGGVNVFGGGLALYDKNHGLVGAVGVSGDTSCADHNVAWRTRANLKLDFLATIASEGSREAAVPTTSSMTSRPHRDFRSEPARAGSAIRCVLPIMDRKWILSLCRRSSRTA